MSSRSEFLANIFHLMSFQMSRGSKAAEAHAKDDDESEQHGADLRFDKCPWRDFKNGHQHREQKNIKHRPAADIFTKRYRWSFYDGSALRARR